MTPEKILTASYYVNLFIKGVLALCVAVAGWNFKNINGKIDDLQSQHSVDNARLSVVESTNMLFAKQLDRVEGKLDRILEIAKKVQ